VVSSKLLSWKMDNCLFNDTLSFCPITFEVIGYVMVSFTKRITKLFEDERLVTWPLKNLVVGRTPRLVRH